MLSSQQAVPSLRFPSQGFPRSHSRPADQSGTTKSTKTAIGCQRKYRASNAPKAMEKDRKVEVGETQWRERLKGKGGEEGKEAKRETEIKE